MRYIKVVVILVLFIFCLIFFVQNDAIFSSTLNLKFHLFSWEWNSSPIPIYIFILLALLVGGLISMLYFLLDNIRNKKEVRQLKNYIRKLEDEVNSLRSMPVTDSQAEGESTQAISEEPASITSQE